MAVVAFVVEQVGGETGAAVLRVGDLSGPNPFAKAVEEMRGRPSYADPATARMLAEHLAEVALSAWLERDEIRAGQAAAALLAVQEQPHLMVRASRLQGDIEISGMDPIEAGTDDEAEEVFGAAVEKLLSTKPGQ